MLFNISVDFGRYRLARLLKVTDLLPVVQSVSCDLAQVLLRSFVLHLHGIQLGLICASFEVD